VTSLVAAVTIGGFAILHAVILWFLPGLTRRDAYLAVTQAYRQLANGGWLEFKRRNGALVRERRLPRAGPEAKERFSRPLRELVARALGEGLSPNIVAREMMKSARKLERGTV